MTPGTKRLLRSAASIAVLIGALGSLGLMLYVGHRNKSVILLLMFAVWVVAPFALLGWAARSNRWSGAAQTTLQLAALVVTVATLVVYGRVAFGPPAPRPASKFLIMPAVSLLLTGIALWIAARGSRRHTPAL